MRDISPLSFKPSYQHCPCQRHKMRKVNFHIVLTLLLFLTTLLNGQDQQLKDFLLEKYGRETFNISYPLVNSSTLLLSDLEVIRSSKRVKDTLNAFFGEERKMFVNRIPEFHKIYWNINEVNAQDITDSTGFKPRISYPIYSGDHQKALVIAYRLIEDDSEHILLLQKEKGKWALRKSIRTGVYIDRKDHSHR